MVDYYYTTKDGGEIYAGTSQEQPKPSVPKEVQPRCWVFRQQPPPDGILWYMRRGCK